MELRGQSCGHRARPCRGSVPGLWGAHLGLPGVVVGLDQDLAQADVLADGGQGLLHGLPGSQYGHAGDLGRGRGTLPSVVQRAAAPAAPTRPSQGGGQDSAPLCPADPTEQLTPTFSTPVLPALAQLCRAAVAPAQGPDALQRLCSSRGARWCSGPHHGTGTGCPGSPAARHQAGGSGISQSVPTRHGAAACPQGGEGQDNISPAACGIASLRTSSPGASPP